MPSTGNTDPDVAGRMPAPERFLAEANALLCAPGGYEKALAEVAALCVPTLADTCVIDLVRDDGGVECAASAGARAELSDATISVPLRAGDAELGMLTLTRARAAFEESDLALADALAERVGTAIASARLLVVEKQARASAERLASRLERLHAVATELATALTRERIADVIIESGVTAIGAQTGAIYLVEPGGRHARLFRAFGYPEGVLDAFAHTSLSDATPLAEAIRTRRPVLLGTRADYAALFPDSETRTRAVRVNMIGIACLPIIVEGTCIGGIALGFEGPHAFREDEPPFLELLAHHCGEAFHRESMLTAERRYHARVGLLSQASELLSASLDYERTLRTVVKISLPALGDFAFLDIVEESGQVRRVADAHDDEDTRAMLEVTGFLRPSPLHAETRFIAQVDDVVRAEIVTTEAHAILLDRLSLCSIISAPLVSQGELLGALTVCMGPSRRVHDADDVQLATELAHRAAQAVRHARLFRDAQAAMRRAEEAAARAGEASRIKDEFLATISHELRTPLSAILGWAAVLKRADASKSTLDKAIDVIERNARMQHRLIEDVLDVSRIVRGELRIDSVPVDLSVVVQEVVENVRPSATAKGIQLELAIDLACTMLGDPDRLRQITWNLLANAVKFSPEHARVFVSLRPDRGKLELVVRDEGIGIAHAFLPHVFERFRQADGSSTRAHGGLGLGLAIVRHLTEMHGGNVVASSEGLGRGATFTVTLPVKAITSHAPRAEDLALPRAPLGKLRVLVVDDDDDARELIELVLRRHGAEVESAATPSRALAAFALFSPDVVVSDIGMPEHDGFWLLDALRTRAPELPILALTAYSRPEDKARAANASFDHYLAKPVDADRLISLLTEYATHARASIDA